VQKHRHLAHQFEFAGRDRDEIVDAVVHLAVALKYLEGKGRES